MVLLKNIFATAAFLLLFNGIHAQQSVSNNEQSGNSEVTTIKKANPKIEKVELSDASNTPTWERSQNPNIKKNEIVIKEEHFITDQKAKNPKK